MLSPNFVFSELWGIRKQLKPDKAVRIASCSPRDREPEHSDAAKDQRRGHQLRGHQPWRAGQTHRQQRGSATIPDYPTNSPTG